MSTLLSRDQPRKCTGRGHRLRTQGPPNVLRTRWARAGMPRLHLRCEICRPKPGDTNLTWPARGQGRYHLIACTYRSVSGLGCEARGGHLCVARAECRHLASVAEEPLDDRRSRGKTEFRTL